MSGLFYTFSLGGNFNMFVSYGKVSSESFKHFNSEQVWRL